MIHSRHLLDALRRLLPQLERDLRERLDAQPAIEAGLKAEWQQARDRGRSSATYADWREDEIAQAAAHWVLACVFLRFIEDNGLVERPWLSAPDRARRHLAQDRHEQYFREHPLESDRDYLLACFADAARLPGLAGLFDPAHNPLWRLTLSGDAAMVLLAFWQQIDPDTGSIHHDFTTTEDPGVPESTSPLRTADFSRPEFEAPDYLPTKVGGPKSSPSPLDTRFLGDLYQDLSEPVRKRYALLQTPEFVEEFILDRTLTPALAEFGYREIRLIDPTCGSGHFLLGAFRRLFDLWTANEPARNLPDLAQRALDAVYGVDINPYAVAIARFRLMMAAVAAAGVARLADAPDFRVHCAVGDSLLHGRRFNALDLGGEAENLGGVGFAHAYATEDLEAVRRILAQQYHVVVGNPPYITVKDAAVNGLYRQLYASCHRQYSLVVPFTERFFDLALPASGSQPAGYVGLIVADSFMKREFGKKLIEEFLPRVDLTHVIATSGAYIPGHGTPTVILFGRNRRPVESVVRTVMGIKGEPTTPDDPARGLVWTAILEQLAKPGSESAFVSVSDVPRAIFGKHPWSIGGGGASDLRELLDSRARKTLIQLVTEIGFGALTREDDAFLVSRSVALRKGVEACFVLPMIAGENVRDWSIAGGEGAVWPYDRDSLEAATSNSLLRLLWPYRRQLSFRVAYGLSQLERGLEWFEYSMFFRGRFRVPLSIAFAFVATHNQFVLDRGGKVFNRTAPVIKLPASATEGDHLALLGLLNSSAASFWMKQVFMDRGNGGIGGGIASEPWERFFEHDATKIKQFPLADPPPTDLARQLDTLARELADCLPAAVLATAPGDSNEPE